nr:hypothetical protein [Tanacetum cinerariifolium]
KPASTPIDAEKPLLKDSDGEDVDVHTYRELTVVSQDSVSFDVELSLKTIAGNSVLMDLRS